MSAAVDLNLLRAALTAFRPPARPGIREWAEANVRLTGEMAAQPGPVRFSTMQSEILAAIDDTSTSILVLMLASQTGKSTVIDAALLHSVEVDPAPTLVVHPTEAKGKDYVRTRLDPLLDANPNLRKLIGKGVTGKAGRGGTGDGVAFKAFPGGSISVASSFKAEDLAARAIKRLLLDEVDRFALSAGKEGDPITLAMKRTRTFPDRKIVIASTPTATGASRIDEWFRRGTMERFAIPCPECGAFFVPVFDLLKWDEGKPRAAVLECSECAHHLGEAERLKAINLGTFIATNPTPEEGVRSVHASEIVSPFSSLAEIVAAYEACGKDPLKLKAFTNTTLGETFDMAAEAANDPGDLQARAVPLAAPYPRDVRFITAGADVQGNRIEVTVLAHAPARRIVLDHLVFGGDPTGPEVWRNLDRLLASTFALEGGRNLPVSAMFVDAGFMSQHVQAFALRHPRVYSTFGRGGWERPAVREGQRITGSAKRSLILGVDGLKLAAAKALQIAESEAGHIVLPAHLQSDYFEQLAAERLETSFKRGFPTKRWVKDPTTRNEAFDCLAYAIAAATIVKIPPIIATDTKPTLKELAASLKNNGQATKDNVTRLN